MDDRTSKGGKARAASLTPHQRSESARKAVQARWRKTQQASTPPAPVITMSVSELAPRGELITYDVREDYGTPSPTAGMKSWNASSPSFVISLNKTRSSTQ